VRVYRGEGEKPWQAVYRQVAELEASRTDWMDKGLKTGASLHYRLRVVDADGREGPAGPAARTRPPIVEDVVVSVLSAGAVEVRWTPRAAEDIVGHHVERAVVKVATDDQLRRLKRKVAPLDPPSVGAVLRVGPFERLTREPGKVPAFTDRVDLKKPAQLTGEPLQEQKFHKDHWDASGRPYPFAVYAYRVRATNMLGVESGPSPAILTIPSIPQHLFSKEEEAACRLKWRANPEKGLRGYRVYRMDGRWEKNPISRLTPDPIDACAFTDPGADGKSRRYYVVAVDAIGQEGYPSTPVWYQREWRKYYEPFVGEWHQ
jgi:hypothetical protein